MTDFDAAVLAIVLGADLVESIKRLYLSGEIDEGQLADCVSRGLLELADYNTIIEGR